MTQSRRWFLKKLSLTAFTFGCTLGGLNSATGQNPKHSTPVLDTKPHRKVNANSLVTTIAAPSSLVSAAHSELILAREEKSNLH